MRISKKGFTLIEVMVAAAILGIGCLGVLGLMMTAIKYNNDSHLRTKATYIAEQEATLFQIEKNSITSKCDTSWTKITDAKYLPDDDNFRVFCKKIDDTAQSIGTHKPIAIRVAWGDKCTDAQILELDSYEKARQFSQCDFVTVSYVPFNTFDASTPSS